MDFEGDIVLRRGNGLNFQHQTNPRTFYSSFLYTDERCPHHDADQSLKRHEDQTNPTHLLLFFLLHTRTLSLITTLIKA